MKITRIIIYRKDIMRITGHSERYARNLMQRIRKHLNKSNHHLVTVEEFCQYTGLNPEEVKSVLD